MKIGVVKGNWGDMSNFKTLGAIYTKVVIRTLIFIIQHISSLLSVFFFFFLTDKFPFLPEIVEI